jgi:Tautomerase enzyme
LGDLTPLDFVNCRNYAISTPNRAICRTDWPLEFIRLMIAIDGDMVPRATKTQSSAQVRKAIMPLLSFDLIGGRSESELKKILDVTHEVLFETLQVPKHDRYQVVHEHKRPHTVTEEHGARICQIRQNSCASDRQSSTRTRNEPGLLTFAGRKAFSQLRNFTNRRGYELCDERR